MKVLVLGASGMLGSTMARVLGQTPGLRVMAGLRQADGLCAQTFARWGVPVQTGWDAHDEHTWQPLLDAAAPEVVINCIGILNPFAARGPAVSMVIANACFPRALWARLSPRGVRLVHFSSSHVFSGLAGRPYTEHDRPDPLDLYGRTKRWGEPDDDLPGALTLRTCAIGPELARRQGMLAWFLAQPRAVHARRHAWYCPLTTLELAEVVRNHLLEGQLSGLYHLGGEAIDEDRLLRLIAHRWQRPAPGLALDTGGIDRRLDSSRFCAATGYAPPDWATLLQRQFAAFSAAGR